MSSVFPPDAPFEHAFEQIARTPGPLQASRRCFSRGSRMAVSPRTAC